MRILVAHRSLAVGGGSTFCINLARALRARGHSLGLVAAPGAWMRRAREAFDRVYLMPLWHRWQAGWLGNLARREGYQVLNSHATSIHNLAAIAAQRAGVPLLVTMHGQGEAHCLPAYRAAQAVVAMNETNLGTLESLGVPKKKLRLARLIVDWDYYSAREAEVGKPKDQFLVTYCSRLSRLKGPLAFKFLVAGAKLAREVPELRMQVVGAGRYLWPVRILARSVNRPLGEGRCRVLGDKRDVSEVFARSHVVVGAGYVAVEALAAGCLVVGAGFCGCYGLVTSQELASAVAANFGDNWAGGNDGSAELFLAALRQAYEVWRGGGDPELCPSAKATFALEAVAPTLEAIFQEVLRAGPC